MARIHAFPSCSLDGYDPNRDDIEAVKNHKDTHSAYLHNVHCMADSVGLLLLLVVNASCVTQPPTLCASLLFIFLRPNSPLSSTISAKLEGEPSPLLPFHHRLVLRLSSSTGSPAKGRCFNLAKFIGRCCKLLFLGVVSRSINLKLFFYLDNVR